LVTYRGPIRGEMMQAMGTLTLADTPLVPKGPAAAIVLDDEQVAALGEGAKRFPVRVTVNGHELRLSVARMRGQFLIGFSKANREAAGVQPGDAVNVTIALDEQPREVETPPALAEALEKDPAAKTAFDGLAYTHRKEFARWVAEAKRDETRDRRVAKALEMLHDRQTLS
jgi:hypothetical protein